MAQIFKVRWIDFNTKSSFVILQILLNANKKKILQKIITIKLESNLNQSLIKKTISTLTGHESFFICGQMQLHVPSISAP
jgi:HKD family nuclease